MWNYLISNKILNQNNRFRIHQNHLEKLIQIKSNINNKNSDYLKYRKLNKSYNIENDYKKYKIHYDNLKLCNNLDSIYYHPGPYNKNTIVPKYCPVFDKKKYHYNKCEYFINLAKDNIKFFNKFNSIKPVYQRKFFLNENNNFLTRSNSQDLNKTINYNNPNLNFVTFQKFKMNLMKEIKSCGMKLLKKKKISQVLIFLENIYLKKIKLKLILIIFFIQIIIIQIIMVLILKIKMNHLKINFYFLNQNIQIFLLIHIVNIKEL